MDYTKNCKSAEVVNFVGPEDFSIGQTKTHLQRMQDTFEIITCFVCQVVYYILW